MPLAPTREQVQQLVQSDLDGPVVMLNLLKFSRKTDDGVSGRDSYEQYGQGVRSMLEKTGARVLWHGRVDSVVIGDEADHWDSVILVEYPSRKAFIEMTSSKSYGEVAKSRTAGLDDSRLIAMTELSRYKGG
ncbi:MAG: DUF1330 domain-containing protein [Dehalococcoidia bacterium]